MPTESEHNTEWPPDIGDPFPNSRILTSVVEEDYVMVDCFPGALSTFELVLSSSPPILESLLLQIPTKTILQLYHTSSYLRRFLKTYPTAWKYLSFRLAQPSAPPPAHNANNDLNGTGLTRPSPNYGVDQLLIYIVNPFSTNLTSLELDNTAVSGTILLQTVLNRRRETLEHLSVRGCKNVSLKYHIVDWLKGFWTASDPLAPLSAAGHDGGEFKNLALKSLYTYRCRHHRRRPYLPSSLLRRDSDSEPTHDIVTLCHKLGIWTDTAWCTTPGARCFRRRGYVTMRVPQDPREVWVVYDRLWRSKNWVGPVDETQSQTPASNNHRRRDGRSWEQNEEASLGEPLGTGVVHRSYREGKFLPMHKRKSHREFVEDVTCGNCSAKILERCEQCSVLMHCAGCRKTLCASCSFDRPYLRNRRQQNPEEDIKDKFWWAPGCLVSPCSMQDQDEATVGPGPNPLPTSGNLTPTIKFKWCCTEPVFSGGGGITFGAGLVTRDVERVRASPLPRGVGWEDPEFQDQGTEKCEALVAQGHIPDPRTALDSAKPHETMLRLLGAGKQSSHVPRNLCDDCYNSKDWKVHCKACSVPLCLEHDLRGLRMRVCGFKDLKAEKEAMKTKQRNIMMLACELRRLNLSSVTNAGAEQQRSIEASGVTENLNPASTLLYRASSETENSAQRSSPLLHQPMASLRQPPLPPPPENPRAITPDSNATESLSRASSPAPSVASDAAADEGHKEIPEPSDSLELHPKWTGCYSFSCPQHRAMGDHRRRCTAILKECLGCKVFVCGTCIGNMEKPCTCEGCKGAEEGDSSSSNGIENFWCPNCRWERQRDGKCSKREEIEKQEKLQKLKEKAESTALPPESQGTATAEVQHSVVWIREIIRWEHAPEPSDHAETSASSVAGTREMRTAVVQEVVRRLQLNPTVDDVD